MAKINDTTTFPNTAPALGDHVPGTDISNTGNDAAGETVTFTMQAVMDLFEANMTVPTSVSSAYRTSTILSSTSNAEGAALIGIEDSGTYFSGATVEAALAEIGALLPAEANADVTDETNVLAALSGATLTEVTPAATDKILILDADDTFNIKNVTWSDVTAAAAAPEGTSVLSTGPVTDGYVLTADGAGAAAWEAVPATAWDDPINSSITVDTDSTYDLGTTAARIANGFFDQVYASGALVMTEVADNPVTPTAGIGQLWTSDDTTQKLMFTDDAGTDKEVAFVTGGTDLSAYTGVLGLNSGTAVDVNTKALLEARLSDVSDLAEADGDVYTGVHDFGGATSLEIPNSATPTVDAAGEIAIDTTVTDFSHGILKYFSGEEMAVVAMPIAQFTSPTGGYVVAYNATNDEFELVSQAGGGDMSAATYDPATIAEQLVGLTATQTLTNKTLTSPTINTPSIGTSFTFDSVTVTGLTGSDVNVVSGTAGTNGNLAMWNADGDAVDSTVVAANVVVDGDIGSTVQAYDADTLKADTADQLTAGFTAAVDDDGAAASPYTPDPDTGNYKRVTNDGAMTINAPTMASGEATSMIILLTNTTGAGAITFGTTTDSGDTIGTTTTDEYLISITAVDVGGTTYSHATVKALQ